MDETRTETNNNMTNYHIGRVQPRRSSRSALSNSPTTKEDRNGVLPEQNSNTTVSPSISLAVGDATNANDNDNNSTASTIGSTTALATHHHSRVTRSLSADSNSNEESPSLQSNTSGTGKRRRPTSTSNKASNKKRTGTTAAAATTTTTTTTAATATATVSPSLSPYLATTGVKSPPRGTSIDDFERETRNTTQRLTKEAKDARKAERGIIVKRKLDALDMLEQTVKDQSHQEYQHLLKEIQEKRDKKLGMTEGKYALMESHFRNGFLAQKKSAFDKFYFDKLALRRNMMNQIQQKINKIEQEYFYSQQNTKSTLDDHHLNEWTPPDRPSMISSLTLGLNDQDIEKDLTELQDLVPTSIDDTHSLDPSKKTNLTLISST